MRKSLRRALLASLLSLLFLATPQAYAWGSPGHMAVAYVAYQKLTPATKARVQQLLQLNPDYNTWLTFIPAGTTEANKELYLFMMAATWPDEIKAAGSGYHGNDFPPADPAKAAQNTGYTDTDMHKYWHFVDTPFTTDGSTTTPASAFNATTEIAIFRTTLASNASDDLKSYDLVWAEHLVGDLHQPLHCTTRFVAGVSDSGGNAVTLTGTPNELHALWDQLPGVGVTKDFAIAVAFAKTLNPASTRKAADTNEAHWVQESYAMAKSAAYKKPVLNGSGPYTITAKYKATALADAKLRISTAGARLANFLNANLK